MSLLLDSGYTFFSQIIIYIYVQVKLREERKTPAHDSNLKNPDTVSCARTTLEQPIPAESPCRRASRETPGAARAPTTCTPAPLELYEAEANPRDRTPLTRISPQNHQAYKEK